MKNSGFKHKNRLNCLMDWWCCWSIRCWKKSVCGQSKCDCLWL